MENSAGIHLSSGRKRGKASSASSVIGRQRKASKKKACPSSKKQNPKTIPQTMACSSSLLPDLNAVPIPDPNEYPTQTANASQSIQKNAHENNSPEKFPESQNERNALSSETVIQLDNEKFPDIVKMIRRLELEGHISPEFRLKFLTWFSFRSTEQDIRVVACYVRVMSDDLQKLGEQLVHSFSEIVFNHVQA